MQTVIVIDNDILNNNKIILTNKKDNHIDYYLDRNTVIRWDKKNNIFHRISGLIGVGYTTDTLIPEKEAKTLATFNNTKYLLRYTYVGDIDIINIDHYGKVYRCVAEDVKNKIKIFDEYHIIFDDEYQNVDIKYINKYYGSTFDYVEQRNRNI